MEGRKETATKEDGKRMQTLKCSGPRLSTQGRCDEESRVTDVSRVGSSALSSSLAQSGNCVWASQAGKGEPTSLWQIRFQGSSLANLSRGLKQGNGPGETEPTLSDAVSSRDAVRWDSQGGYGSGSAQLGDAKTPGDPQGALRVRIYSSELRARLGLRTAPLLS